MIPKHSMSVRVRPMLSLRSVLLSAALALAGCGQPIPGPLPKSDHFDGQHFFNPDGDQGSGGEQKKSKIELLRELLYPPDHSWPAHVVVTQTRPTAHIDGQAMRSTWIGHSTVLVQTQGLNILTDPVWAERAAPVQWAGVKRVREPGVRFDDLPHIDLVLISHDHYDHLDTDILHKLWKRDRPLIVAGLGMDRLLAHYGIPAVARDWGQSVPVREGVAVILDRVHHWSAHRFDAHDQTLWTGFTVTLPGGNLYYAGDTGPGDMRWALEASRTGPVRLALLPIGAYHFHGKVSGNHIGPQDAVKAFTQLHASYGLGVHWGTFELTNEAIDEPPRVLSLALKTAQIAPDRFRATQVGQGWDVPAMSADASQSMR
jgi:L-ascorbate metabolism protein UlaG (beta-lactamase superfamily)